MFLLVLSVYLELFFIGILVDVLGIDGLWLLFEF